MHSHTMVQVGGMPRRWVCVGCGKLTRVPGALKGLSCARDQKWPKTTTALLLAGTMDQALTNQPPDVQSLAQIMGWRNPNRAEPKQPTTSHVPPPSPTVRRQRSRSPSIARICRRNMKAIDADIVPTCKCPKYGWHVWTDAAASSTQCYCRLSLGGGLPPASPAGLSQGRTYSSLSGRSPSDGAAWKRRRSNPTGEEPALLPWEVEQLP